MGSSKIKIFGFFINALANAIFCFSPPESIDDLLPTLVFNPSGKALINENSGFSIIFSFNEYLPKAVIFSFILASNRLHCCVTTAKISRYLSILYKSIGLLFNSIKPSL